MPNKTRGRPRADTTRDLRSHLLKISRALLEEQGPGELSLREVARRAGCTHQAPYHYFSDRESLIAALVLEGYNELAAGLRAARERNTGGEAQSLLAGAGRAYLDFALAQPGLFRVMFRPDVCDPARFDATRQAGGEAFRELQLLARAVSDEAEAAEVALILWAHVHGLAGLLLDSPAALSLGGPEARGRIIESVQDRFARLLLASREASRGDPENHLRSEGGGGVHDPAGAGMENGAGSDLARSQDEAAAGRR